MASSNLLLRCVLDCLYSFINIIYTLTSSLTSFLKTNFYCSIVDLQCYVYFCCTAKRAVMYRYESLTIKKAECWRIDAFELWCWRRLLRVPWTARRQNQSILKEINPEYSLKDWCWSWSSNIWPPDVKSWLIGKDPDAGQDWRQEVKEMTEMVGWHHWLNGLEFE